MEKSLLEQIIIECVKHKIRVSVKDVDTTGNLIYEVHGFSKSGTVDLWLQKPNLVMAESRYQEFTDIHSFKDLSGLAWDWYLRYKDREPFTNPDSYWVPVWLEEGRIKKQVEIKNTYIIN